MISYSASDEPLIMKKISFFILMFALWHSAVQAQNFSIDKIISSPPSPSRLVNDYAGILTPDQLNALEQKLVQFDKTTSSQIVVVTVPSLEGKDVADAAIELGRKWGVGGQKNNNGVVLLVSIGDRKLNISPGYGLEKALPDLTAQQIIDNNIKPNFKGQDYYRGLDEGTDAIIQATQGEYKAPADYYRKGKSLSPGKIFLIIILIIVFLSMFGGGGGRGGSFMSRRGYRGFAGPIFFPGGGGGWGGGGSSGGGGGFGGFGGGSFGGGGASGDW